MGTVERILERYTNKKKRWESDCAVIEEMCTQCAESESEQVRKEAYKWLIGLLEDKETNKLARQKVVRYLYAQRHDVPGKVRKRFKKYIGGLKKAKRKKLLFE